MIIADDGHDINFPRKFRLKILPILNKRNSYFLLTVMSAAGIVVTLVLNILYCNFKTHIKLFCRRTFGSFTDGN